MSNHLFVCRRGENLRYVDGRAVCPTCGWSTPWHGPENNVGQAIALSCPSCRVQLQVQPAGSVEHP